LCARPFTPGRAAVRLIFHQVANWTSAERSF